MFAEISPALLGRWAIKQSDGTAANGHNDSREQMSPEHGYNNYTAELEDSRAELDQYIDVVEKIARVDSLIASTASNSSERYDMEHRHLDRAGLYHIGAEYLDCSPRSGNRCFQILVRPDLSEDALLSLSEALLLGATVGGNKQNINRRLPPSAGYHCTDDSVEVAGSSVKKSVIDGAAMACGPPQRTVVVECVSRSSSQLQLWSSIRLLLSVNMQMQRCLVLHIQPSDTVRGTIGTLNGSGKAFTEFSISLVKQLHAAMEEEAFTLRHLADSAPTHRGIAARDNVGPCALNPLVKPQEQKSTKKKKVDSVLDLAYLRDLQAACAQRMLLLLRHEAEYFDNHVKLVEQQCARLMTLLSASYKRSADFLESLPQLPGAGGKSSLAKYPLQLERSQSIELVLTEEIKLILLRARKKFRQERKQIPPSNGSAANNPEEYSIVHNDIKHELLSWAHGEFTARLRRKLQYVRERVLQIQQFRLQLVLTLHQRYMTHGDFQSGFESTNPSLRANADRLLQISVKQKFSFVDIDEPTIIDCPAIVNGRSGVLYLTLSYLLFYGGGFLLSNPEILVVSLKTVEKLEMVDREGNFYSYHYHPQVVGLELAAQSSEANGVVLEKTQSYNDGVVEVSFDTDTEADGEEGKAAADERSMGQLLSIMNAVRLVDNFGQRESLIRIKGPTPDYTNRLTDLLDLIIKNQLHWLKLSSPVSASGNKESATKAGSDASADSSADAIPILTHTVAPAPVPMSEGVVTQRNTFDDIDDIMNQLDMSIAAITQVQSGAADDVSQLRSPQSHQMQPSDELGLDLLEISAGPEDCSPHELVTENTQWALNNSNQGEQEGEESKQLEELSQFFNSTTPETTDEGAFATTEDEVGKTTVAMEQSSGRVSGGKKSLAGNIQKFLQKSQQQKKKDDGPPP